MGGWEADGLLQGGREDSTMSERQFSKSISLGDQAYKRTNQAGGPMTILISNKSRWINMAPGSRHLSFASTLQEVERYVLPFALCWLTMNFVDREEGWPEAHGRSNVTRISYGSWNSETLELPNSTTNIPTLLSESPSKIVLMSETVTILLLRILILGRNNFCWNSAWHFIKTVWTPNFFSLFYVISWLVTHLSRSCFPLLALNVFLCLMRGFQIPK